MSNISVITLESEQYWATFYHLKHNVSKLSIQLPPSQSQMQNYPQLHIDWVVNSLRKITNFEIIQGLLTEDRRQVMLFFTSENDAVEFKLRYL